MTMELCSPQETEGVGLRGHITTGQSSEKTRVKMVSFESQQQQSQENFEKGGNTKRNMTLQASKGCPLWWPASAFCAFQKHRQPPEVAPTTGFWNPSIFLAVVKAKNLHLSSWIGKQLRNQLNRRNATGSTCGVVSTLAGRCFGFLPHLDQEAPLCFR